MKKLKIKNREKREMEGLKILTQCICNPYSFEMPEIWVPVASKEVPVASRRVGVASKDVRVASRRVLIGSEFTFRRGWPASEGRGLTAEPVGLSVSRHIQGE